MSFYTNLFLNRIQDSFNVRGISCRDNNKIISYIYHVSNLYHNDIGCFSFIRPSFSPFSKASA